MKVIVCVDDRGGVAFHNRRQSRDKILVQKILEMVGEHRLYLSEYSRKLFEDRKNIVVENAYLELAKKDDYCFVELDDLSRYEEKVTTLILVKWNRTYPGSIFLRIDLNKYNCIDFFEFKGNSHEKITVEVYEKTK